MNEFPKRLANAALATRWSYRAEDSAADGSMRSLIPKLQMAIRFDRVQVERDASRGLSTRLMLFLIFKSRRIFELQINRVGLFWSIEVISNNPGTVRKAARVCRNHFDSWFGVVPIEGREFDYESGDA